MWMWDCCRQPCLAQRLLADRVGSNTVAEPLVPPFPPVPHAASLQCVSCIHQQEFISKASLVSRKKGAGEGSMQGSNTPKHHLALPILPKLSADSSEGISIGIQP